MRNAFRKIHLWLSIPFGLIVSVICLTGASLVFETELMELCYRDRYYVEQVGEEALPVDVLLAKVKETLPDSVSTTGVTISSNPKKACQVGVSQPRRASVGIDQYTGEVKGMNKKTAFFDCMLRMHRWLLDSMKPGGGMSVGKTVVGISTLLLVFILISGVVVWVPRTAKGLKMRLKISVSKGWRRFWHDLHLAGGIWTAVILLALALTGLTWSFSWYRAGFYKVFGVEAPQSPHGNNRGKGERGNRKKEVGTAGWQLAYEQLKEINPEYKQISLSDGSANVSFNKWGNQRGSDRYTFNSRNGEIEAISLYKNQEKAGKLRGWIYSVHVGSWGGLFSKTITFIAAFIGGTLPLTGYYLWIKKRLRKRKGRTVKL